jgi:hypothetical protein
MTTCSPFAEPVVELALVPVVDPVPVPELELLLELEFVDEL